MRTKYLILGVFLLLVSVACSNKSAEEESLADNVVFVDHSVDYSFLKSKASVCLTAQEEELVGALNVFGFKIAESIAEDGNSTGAYLFMGSFMGI